VKKFAQIQNNSKTNNLSAPLTWIYEIHHSFQDPEVTITDAAKRTMWPFLCCQYGRGSRKLNYANFGKLEKVLLQDGIDNYKVLSISLWRKSPDT
jgi:hypothetical protein